MAAAEPTAIEGGRTPPTEADDGAGIRCREDMLRAWFTRDADAARRQVDGLDIGWGGVQAWATARMPTPGRGLHLDFACGYGTFLAQLGWRFPAARFVGLNIDFEGPHAIARPLLAAAGVHAELVAADTRRMPFASGAFGSASCFLGLQDVEIGFGEPGVLETVEEAVRALRPGGTLTVLDEWPLERFQALLGRLPVRVIDCAQRALDVRWDRDVAQAAVRLYAQGWVDQMRLPPDDSAGRRAAYEDALARMNADVDAQISKQGTYIPFGPVRMVVAVKGDEGR